MTRTAFATACTALLCALAPAADPAPATLLADKGKLLFSDDFDKGLGKEWRAAKGKWEAADGSVRGAEVKADMHGAVARLATPFHNAVIEYSFKLDGAHPFGASHHHKIAVFDDRLAFCGGIDMTAARWDTRGHCDRDPRRKRPTTGRAYHPWHDASMAVSGEAARALGEHCRQRWLAAGGSPVTARHAISRRSTSSWSGCNTSTA